MYRFIKSLLKNIIPQKLLFHSEPVLRKIYAIGYFGNSYSCNVCNHSFSKFIPIGKEELLCPYCGSMARNRRLWKLLDPIIKGRILDFSPSRCLYRILKKRKGIEYISTDFENEFIADKKYDITHLPEPDESFDFIICYHILEHIEDDIKAMSELYRVLKRGGQVFIQTPFKEGEIYEDYSIKDPQERNIHFGQEDHVRIYSSLGLKQRLDSIGFATSIEHFPPNETDKHFGFNPDEKVLIAKKCSEIS
jgi:SAM-dependent methyltransferase